MKLQTVLFPTDFSENSIKALPFALQIAQKTGSRLRLFHIVKGAHDIAPLPHGEQQTKRKTAHRRLRALIQEIDKDRQYEKLNIQTSVRTAPPADSILEEAEECDAGLIVMGSKGASGIKKLLFGSVASNTILGSNLPVLLIPEQSNFWGFDHITFASNYNNRDLAALRFIVDWAEIFQSEITILHVALHEDLESDLKFRGFREYVRKRVDYRNIEFMRLVSRNFYTGLADYLTDHTTQMIAMVRHKKPFFRSLVGKNLTKKMSFSTKVPLLILPVKKDRPTRNDQAEPGHLFKNVTLSPG